jgi:hypothetical protein
MKGRFPKFGVFARRDNRMGIASRNRIVASACIVCAVRRNTPDLFVWWNLVEQVREHRRISNAAARGLNCTYFQCSLIDPNVDFAPKAAFRAVMLTRVSLSYALNFNAGAIDEQM